MCLKALPRQNLELLYFECHKNFYIALSIVYAISVDINAITLNTWAITQRKLSDPESYLNNCNDFEVKALSLSLQRIEILRQEAEILGFLNFDFFMQSEAVTSWHRAIRSNFTGGDAQGDRKRLNSIFKMGRKAEQFNSINLPPFEYIDKHLLEYRDSLDLLSYSLAQEYSLASAYECLFLEVLSNRFKTDDELKKLTLKRWNIFKEISKVAEKEKGVYLFQCPYCRKRSVVAQGKTPASCKDPKCKKAYKDSWEEEGRNYQPKNTRLDAGWVVAFDGERKMCKGAFCVADGGRLRQVNLANVCFGCYLLGGKLKA